MPDKPAPMISTSKCSSEGRSMSLKFDFVHKSELPGSARWRRHRQRILCLLPLQLGLAAQQRNAANLAALQRTLRPEGFRTQFRTRPIQRNHVKRLAFGGVTDILPGERLAFRIGKTARENFSRTFAVNLKRTRSVDRLPVYREPAPDSEQNRLHLFWNGSIGTRSDVQQ